MAIDKKIAAQRVQILAQTRAYLESTGVNLWELDQSLQEKRFSRREFSTPLLPGAKTKYLTIPEGNEEVRTVGVGLKGKAPRCQANSHAKGGKQCGGVAVKGYRTCRTHGGGRLGKTPPEVVAKTAAKNTTTGACQRVRDRAAAHKELKELNTIGMALGFMAPTINGPKTATSEQYMKRRAINARRSLKRARVKLGMPIDDLPSRPRRNT